jgi:dCTP deaminase
MRLTDIELTRLLNSDSDKPYQLEYLQVTPKPTSGAVTGVTIDLTLGNSFRRFLKKEFIGGPLDLSSPTLTEDVQSIMHSNASFDADSIIIEPGELLLGITAESVRIPTCLVGWLDGRSSLARVGLQVHATAHRIDPGWDGKIVLEFINAGPAPLRLTAGMKICAISFETTGGRKVLELGDHSVLLGDIATQPVAIAYTAKPDSKYVNQTTVETSKTCNG